MRGSGSDVPLLPTFPVFPCQCSVLPPVAFGAGSGLNPPQSYCIDGDVQLAHFQGQSPVKPTMAVLLHKGDSPIGYKRTCNRRNVYNFSVFPSRSCPVERLIIEWISLMPMLKSHSSSLRSTTFLNISSVPNRPSRYIG